MREKAEENCQINADNFDLPQEIINKGEIKESKKSSWKKIFELVKDYFVNSDEKLIAWLLLIGITLCVIGLVALMAAFSWWSAGFWAVLMAKALTPFLISIGQFALLVCASIAVHVLKNYLMGNLSIRWRNWLTNNILNKLFDGENNFLDLKRFSNEIDNISQSIQEDIKSFVDLTLNLGFDFFKSVLTLGVFVGTLWVVGGALSLAFIGLNIVIPGYLVWVALIIAIVATIATHYIGKSLAEKNQKAERAEADLRQELALLNEEAENIAEEHAEDYYKKSLETKIQEITNNANEKLNVQTKLIAFQHTYEQVSEILPTILSVPLYFSGLIELGQIMQIGMSFGQVSASLSWFVETYEDLSKYNTSIERITELKQSFEKEGLAANAKSIVRKEKDKDFVNIKQLSILQPRASSTQVIMRNLDLKLVPGENVLIKGPSGLGKSTLFKAISGTWQYGGGKINVPSGKTMYFLPQKPSLPYDTLKAILAYPDPVEAYTDEQYIAALESVGGMKEFIPKLQENEKKAWSKELSSGQQQRISFARAILKKPDWLFLDEATSALDEESERHVYGVVNELKETTIVSIAHRSTVEKYHSKIVYFSANEEKDIEIKSVLANCSFN